MAEAVLGVNPTLVLLCIPSRYNEVMTRQISIRMPSELVEFVDSLVARGEASSRAAVVIRALTHEQRRTKALNDVAILSSPQLNDDFDELIAFAAHQPIDLD